MNKTTKRHFLHHVHRLEKRYILPWAQKHSFNTLVYEFLRFGIKQAWACLFGGLLCALLIATFLWYPNNLLVSRYDFLTLMAILIQVMLLSLRLESWNEAKIILVFHIVGTLMEIFKTHMGSWTYPENSLLRIGGVPLFTGFMYAAVGSYIARVWHLFDFHFTRHPPKLTLLLLSVSIYLNFFTHHFLWDLRYALFVLVAYLFGPSWVYYKIWYEHRRMPLLLGLSLVALFIWFAENIGTYTQAWRYPNQLYQWHMVSISKLGSWLLLMIISYTMVCFINSLKTYHKKSNTMLKG